MLLIMFTSSHHLTLAMSLLAGAWSARTTLAVTCHRDQLVDMKQCAQALASIVYDKPENTLDRVSTKFSKLSGNCTITVVNYNKEVVTKQQIEAAYKSISGQCSPNSGSAPLFNTVLLETQNYVPNTGFYLPHPLTCGLDGNRPLTVDKDCQDAYNSIPVDRQGRLLGDKGQPAPSTVKTSKTCTVAIFTTDESPLIAKKTEIDRVVSKSIKECKGKSGLTVLAQGGSGNNGLTMVTVKSSQPFGG
ncbi:hypothetical protein PGT21_011220 [Puccinia graminis f. sp. tritici]|uniref:Uncharacterized protein n=2 Tax=Puccinia graminis f. sp. tritici TaxID=56615 RepID=E3JUC0_PUCGT|nr:uncharacterized protein PGTG_00976 [Puccinia graminis f. sp. tritici CRL 75-36-700-3]EFP75645.2 hypothetical protein PGTG_00976 [Puccinia graminis f. sp. tritici CRL 75-36-700-3]KAA1107361.1 hypothetical protein PGT21_011220 [Puccinia graminis f. sp. tritici]KAA1124830.1 hypothetical protein PGTUg99_050221 [Puccinia graminis f. sp. tritici]